jgi:NAD(P)-dependent dehydrogenase (short-subunit alcohol dehydrogenase family)
MPTMEYLVTRTTLPHPAPERPGAYASRGIRVNAVPPGIIQTPMHPAGGYEGLGDRLPPLGRVGQVTGVVGTILFLESSPYITGEILHVDGGQTAGH